MRNKTKRIILSLFFIAIAVFGGHKLYQSTIDEKKGLNTYKELEKYMEIIESSVEDQTTISWPTIDFSSLQEVNSDVVAWIYIEPLNINYPVVQGKDNDYYLNHLISGKYNPLGSIFLDYRNQPDLLNKHTIIYGHHTNSNSMFTRLEEYKEQSLLDKYPYYLIITPKKKYKVDIFAGYIADPSEASWKINFSSQDEFATWLIKTKEKSLVQSAVTPTINDNVITLSTCYKNSSTKRFVLVGILTEQS